MTAHDEARPRSPLDPGRLRAALAARGGDWDDVAVVDSTGSTNADVLAMAREGAPAGIVVVAEEQVAGRGRLERTWTAPPCSSLLFSVLLRPAPTVPPTAWGWLPLLVGVAVASSLRETTGVDARLKWPNDVVADGPGWDGGPGPRKLAGVLVERLPGSDAAVVGVGLNVDLRADELPTAAASSLWLEVAAAPVAPGGLPAREAVLAGILASMSRRYRAWLEAAGDPERGGLADAYRALCLTLGREVEASLPAGATLRGTAVDIAPDGALLVRTEKGTVAVQAGDVVHLR